MMNKIVIVILFMVFSGGQAWATSEFDEKLKELGVVDSRFVYKDIGKANEIFRELQKAISVSLPQSINSEMEYYGLFLNPYVTRITYRYLNDFSMSEREIIKERLSTKDVIWSFCQEVEYDNHRYMKANNVRVIYTFLNSDYSEIATLDLNYQKCLTSKL